LAYDSCIGVEREGQMNWGPNNDNALQAYDRMKKDGARAMR